MTPAPDINGYYTIVLTSTVIPTNAKMLTGGVGYSYSLSTTPPLTQTNLASYPVYTQDTVVQGRTFKKNEGGLTVPAANVWKVATGFSGRREIVDTAKCNNCHDGLGAEPTFHAGQRNNAPTCSFCHTPNRSSSGWSANASTFIHGIHGNKERTVPFNWHAVSATENFSEVTYPGVLSNCEQCHVTGGYDFTSPQYSANSGAQGVNHMLYSTVAKGILASDGSTYAFSPYITMDYDYGSEFKVDNTTGTSTPAASTTLVTSPIMAACAACHDNTSAITHMTGNGGTFYEPRGNALK